MCCTATVRLEPTRDECAVGVAATLQLICHSREGYWMCTDCRTYVAIDLGRSTGHPVRILAMNIFGGRWLDHKDASPGAGRVNLCTSCDAHACSRTLHVGVDLFWEGTPRIRLALVTGRSLPSPSKQNAPPLCHRHRHPLPRPPLGAAQMTARAWASPTVLRNQSLPLAATGRLCEL